MINHQKFIAVLFELDYLARSDAVAEKFYVDCHQILLFVERKEISPVTKAVSDLRDLVRLKLIHGYYSQLFIKDDDL